MKKLKAIIYTTEGDWVKDDLAVIYKALSKVRNLEIGDIDVVQFTPDATVPTETYPDGDVKMSWGYFRKRFSNNAFQKGYNVVCVHTSDKIHKQWGIKGILGTYRADPDAIMEFYFTADRNERPPRNRTRYLTEFQRMFLHEISHGFERWIFGTTLYGKYKSGTGNNLNLTHYYDWEVKRIDDVFDYYDMGDYIGDYGESYKQTWMVIIMTRLVELYMQLINKMTLPVAKKYWTRVTQAAYNKSSHYRSGIHPGSDHGTPIDTPIQAWANEFSVYETFNNHKSMGNAAYIRFMDSHRKVRWARVLHLNAPAIKGSFKRGEVFAYTGNTGFSTGPHLHIEIWSEPINPARLYTKAGVLGATLDPVAFFADTLKNNK